VVLFASGFLDDPTASAAHADRPDGSLAPVRSPALLSLTELLGAEYHNPGGLPAAVHIAIVRHALSVLLLRIGNHEHRSSQPRDAAFEAFRQSVENGFAHTHRVEDYARQLGYSVRTLTRTSRVATGYGAKRVIQERVLLEAKRLAPTASTSRQPGSTLPSRHHTGAPISHPTRDVAFPLAGRVCCRWPPSATAGSAQDNVRVEMPVSCARSDPSRRVEIDSALRFEENGVGTLKAGPPSC
jgi:AraC-like DNA-binding protein